MRTRGWDELPRTLILKMLYDQEKEIDTWPNYAALLFKVFHPEEKCCQTKRKGHKAWNKKYDLCQVEGCSRPHKARGMCKSHYFKRFYFKKQQERRRQNKKQSVFDYSEWRRRV